MYDANYSVACLLGYIIYYQDRHPGVYTSKGTQDYFRNVFMRFLPVMVGLSMFGNRSFIYYS